MTVSIILPAKNESESLVNILPAIRNQMPDAEIIVVNDGSTDNTEQVARDAGATVITHRYNIGNGASVKAGARAASGDILVFMDADGQHRPEDIKALLNKLDEGYDMVIGARNNASQAGKRRRLGNKLYNKMASLITGHRIDDLTSGFRVVAAKKFREFLQILPNGFSYPTTITMAFFRSGYSVGYVPIITNKRIGESHLKLTRDGIKFLLIIFRIGTLYSPLKLFLPASAMFFILGLVLYVYTFTTHGRLTNMSALLFISSIFVFLIGLISEQITNLIYTHNRQ